MGTIGSDLIQKLMDSDESPVASATVQRVKDDVTSALIELIDCGCRPRALVVNGSHLGFVRGVHAPERRLLFTYFPSAEDRIHHTLALGTTLSPEDLGSLDGLEAQGIIRLIDQCTDADTSLLPYLSAFVTTSASEILWFSRGAAATAYANHRVSLPGGQAFTLLTSPEHSRLWAILSTIRDRAKRNLDATYNAAMITRAFAGKGADKIFTSLKRSSQALQSDSPEPWSHVVKMDLADVNFADGWGHSAQDDSPEGLLREHQGIERMDKHEQAMAAIYKAQVDAAKAQVEEADRRFQAAMEFHGVEDSAVFLSDVEIHELDGRGHGRGQGHLTMDDQVRSALQSGDSGEAAMRRQFLSGLD